MRIIGLVITVIVLWLLFVSPGWVWDGFDNEGFNIGDCDTNRDIDVAETLRESECVYEGEASQPTPTNTPTPNAEPTWTPTPTPKVEEPTPVIPSPTIVPTQAAQPTQPVAPPMGIVPQGQCPTAEAASQMFSLQVIRIGSEPCAFSWNGKGVGATTFTLPANVWGTLHITDHNRVILTDVPNNYEILAATLRPKAFYPSLTCETLLGLENDNRAPVENQCNGTQPVTQPTQSTINPSPAASTTTCPTNVTDILQNTEIKTIIGANPSLGEAGNWTSIDEGTGLQYSGPKVTFNVPTGFTVVDSSGPHTGGQVSTTIFSIYCTG